MVLAVGRGLVAAWIKVLSEGRGCFAIHPGVGLVSGTIDEAARVLRLMLASLFGAGPFV